MKTECEKRLQLEREKLNRLVDEALENGTPIEQTYQIMRQCRRMKRIAEHPVLQSEVIYAQSRSGSGGNSIIQEKSEW